VYTQKSDDASSDDDDIDQRSIVVSDVPEEIRSALITRLQDCGGKTKYTYDAESRKLLVTFEDVAGSCC